MTRFDKYLQAYARYHLEYPTQRAGQAMFNALALFDIKVANQVRSKGWDPFHNDEMVGMFLDFVKRELEYSDDYDGYGAAEGFAPRS